MSIRLLLPMLLLAMAATYTGWFADDRHGGLALMVFALPPALLALWAGLGSARAAFWAGVFALGWFSHGVMLAWSEPGQRGWALLVVALSVAVVLAANLPGLRARFGRRDAGAGRKDP
jgi:uncharacterized membrane protein